jgi:hypothetical protein
MGGNQPRLADLPQPTGVKTACAGLLEPARQRTFCIMGPRVGVAGELNLGRRGESAESAAPDPKPGDLHMGRQLQLAAPLSVAKL